jgi:hypothetical protein
MSSTFTPFEHKEGISMRNLSFPISSLKQPNKNINSFLTLLSGIRLINSSTCSLGKLTFAFSFSSKLNADLPISEAKLNKLDKEKISGFAINASDEE